MPNTERVHVSLEGYAGSSLAEKLIKMLMQESARKISEDVNWAIPFDRPLTLEEVETVLEEAAHVRVGESGKTVESIFSDFHNIVTLWGIRSMVDTAPYESEDIWERNTDLLDQIEQAGNLDEFFRIIVIHFNSSREMLNQACAAVGIDSSLVASLADLGHEYLDSVEEMAASDSQLAALVQDRPELLPGIFGSLNLPVITKIDGQTDLVSAENNTQQIKLALRVISREARLGLAIALLDDGSYNNLRSNVNDYGHGNTPSEIEQDIDPFVDQPGG